MPLKLKSYDELLQEILMQIQNNIAGAAVHKGTAFYALGVALAAPMWGLHQRLAYVSDQKHPITADSQHLEKHAADYALYRKPATMAAGTVTFTGTNGIIIPAGVTLKTATGIAVITTAAVTTVGGTASVSAYAVAAGLDGNLPVALELKAEAAPAGITATATVATQFTGGAEAETDASLLDRLLNYLRQPPAGGNDNDYKQWAISLGGVADAIIFPLRYGVGTVTVLITSDGTGVARIPNAALITTVTNYINSMRPVTSALSLLAPTAKVVDVNTMLTIATGYSFASVEAEVQTVVADWLDSFAPMKTLPISHLIRVITEVDGVADAVVTSPAANVVPVDDGLLVVEMVIGGTVTVIEAV